VSVPPNHSGKRKKKIRFPIGPAIPSKIEKAEKRIFCCGNENIGLPGRKGLYSDGKVTRCKEVECPQQRGGAPKECAGRERISGSVVFQKQLAGRIC